MRREEIAKKILIDEDALFERLVELASNIFKLDHQGQIVWIIPKSKLSDCEKISIILLAQYLSFEAGIAQSEFLENSVIVEKLSMSSASVGARLADLRARGVVHQEKRGIHRIVLHGAEKIVEEITDQFR